MRLFKRPSTSPQLVSATPLQPDGTPIGNPGDKQGNQEEPSTRVNIIERTSENAKNNEMPVPTTTSSFSARKGISTWGKKVGRRWDQLKRSESSELLSVSGRRRRWSPNRQSLDDTSNVSDGPRAEGSSSSGLNKPKRISRVESLRNLFRSSERGSSENLNSQTKKRSLTIEEEEDGVGELDHYKMEKAFSDGALRNVMDIRFSNYRTEMLKERKNQLSHNIQNMQEQQRVFDFILDNQEIIKTNEGMAFVRETLDNARTEVKHRSTTKLDLPNKIRSENADCAKINSVKRNLFDGGNNERKENRRSLNGGGLEDLMCTLRLGCDESGYDSDSTRAGADSPDSENALPPMMKPRSFSITSHDYQGIDLSLPMSTPKKKKCESTNIGEHPVEFQTSSHEDNDCQQARKSEINNEAAESIADSSFDESVRTDTTLMSEDEGDDNDDTDSCDETTFPELSFSPYFHPNRDVPPDCPPAQVSSPGMKKQDELSSNQNIPSAGPAKRVSSRNAKTNVPLGQRVKLQNLQRCAINQVVMRGRKASNASLANLLENAASPCKDSPPASKVAAQEAFDHVRYYSPKRPRSKMESDETEVTERKPIKRPVVSSPGQPAGVVAPASKSMARRELKTVKIRIIGSANLGIKLEKREAVRPFYVVCSLEENGEAAKSKQIRVGDEVVRICGRRLRGMSPIEAKNALKNSIGMVELQIAREPSYSNSSRELGDTWGGETLSRTCSDSEVWTLKETTNEPRDSHETSNRRENFSPLTRMNKSVSTTAMPNTPDRTNDPGLKITGMKKFQVMRKRNSMPAAKSRRTGSTTKSLMTDLLTITLEKGATKKLGFSIVGGSDSNKGNMGIFVKDVMNGGQAAEEGTLRSGDEILAVNGQLMEGLTHAKALQIFKLAKPGLLILHVARRDPMHKRYLGHSKSYDCLAKLAECGDE